MPNLRKKLPTTNSKVKRGFTLIELLVVIAIIGILATFIVASFTSAQKKARDAKRKSDLDAIKKALEIVKSNCDGSAYYPLTNNFPTEKARYIPTESYLVDTDIGALKRPPGTTAINDPVNDATYFYGYSTYNLTAVAPEQGDDVCPDAAGGRTAEGSSVFILTAVLENTSDGQITSSQAKCTLPITNFQLVSYRANSYVVCGK